MHTEQLNIVKSSQNMTGTEINEDLKRWAKTTDFNAPMNWGEIENKILSYEVADSRIMDQQATLEILKTTRRSKFSLVLSRIILVAIFLTTPAILLIASIIGDRYIYENQIVHIVLTILQAITFAINVTFINILSISNKREFSTAPLLIVFLCISLLSTYMIFHSGFNFVNFELNLLNPPFLSLLTIAANVVALIIFYRKGWNIVSFKRKNISELDDTEVYYIGLRKLILDELVRRKLIHDLDVPYMLDMPLRSWRKLINESR